MCNGRGLWCQTQHGSASTADAGAWGEATVSTDASALSERRRVGLADRESEGCMWGYGDGSVWAPHANHQSQHCPRRQHGKGPTPRSKGER